MLLRNNFVANSICGPSRASLLTGKYSHKNGYTLNEKTFDVKQLTFPVLLQQSGYQTAWIGKLHLGSLPIGFNYFNILPGQGQYYNPDFIDNRNDTVRYKGYVTDLISNFLFDWLAKRDDSKPFFVVVGEKATHREWLPDTGDLGAYDSIDFPLPKNFFDSYAGRKAAKDQDMTIDKTMRLKQDLKVHAGFGAPMNENDGSMSPYTRMDSTQRKAYYDYYEKKISADFDAKNLKGQALVKWKFERYLKDYYSTARSLDRNIGRILDYLDSTGLSKNTVVIYASDQGFYLGEHGWFDKRFIYDESLRTAFLARYPGHIRPGTTVDSLISNVDWAPTILDLARTSVPREMQGRSFLPLLLQQEVPDWRKEVYYHYYEYPEPHHVSPHFGIRTKDYMLARYYGGVDSWELFDLRNDAEEMHNLYGDRKHTALEKELKERLKKQIIQQDDKEALKEFERAR